MNGDSEMYRTLLVHVDLQQGSTERIRLAADLARQFEAKRVERFAAGTHQEFQIRH